MTDEDRFYRLAFQIYFLAYFCKDIHLAVAQWIVHMPPKRGIQVRFLSAGPQNCQNLSTGHVDKYTKVFVSRGFV